MFQQELAEIQQKLDVPVPERLALVAEIASDLDAAYAKLIASGVGSNEAKRLTLAEMGDLRHAFRWFVLRDHSKNSFSRFTHWPLYLAAGTLLLGVVGAAAGYRIVFIKWSQGLIPTEMIRAGMAEPLAGVITAATVAGVMVLVHGSLSAWKHGVLCSLSCDQDSESKPWS